MVRAKIHIIVTLVIVILTGVVYASLTSGIKHSVHRDVEGQLTRVQKMFSQSARLESIDFTNLASAYAREDEFHKAFGLSDLTARRQALFVAVEARNARLASQSRKADLIAVTDSD